MLLKKQKGFVRSKYNYDLIEYHLKFNLELSARLNWPTPQVRMYRDYLTATFDVLVALQSFLPHKAHFGIVKKGSSIPDALSSVWMKNANPIQQKTDSSHWLEYIEKLNVETNFVLWASENEITGEVFVDQNLAREIHQWLSKKRIFSLQIGHNFPRPEDLQPFSVYIKRPTIFSAEPTLVFLGDKFKAQLPLASYQLAEGFEFPQKIESFKEDKKLILDFESQLTDSRCLYFKKFVDSTPRIYDRLVLNFPDQNGVDLMAQLKISGFAPSAFPFWILDSWKNWWSEADSESFLRGLCVISLNEVQNHQKLSEELKKIISSGVYE